MKSPIDRYHGYRAYSKGWAWDGVSYARPSGLGLGLGIIGLPPAHTSPWEGGFGVYG